MKSPRQQAKSKRDVPVLRISLTHGNDYDKICEVPEFKHIVMHELVVAVKDGIIKNRKTIELFEISDTKMCLNIEKENWKSSLNQAMEYFTSLENYDKCVECRELIKQL